MDIKHFRQQVAVVAAITRLHDLGFSMPQVAARIQGICDAMVGEYLTTEMASDAGVFHAERLANDDAESRASEKDAAADFLAFVEECKSFNLALPTEAQ
jgi:hypothetical protein